MTAFQLKLKLADAMRTTDRAETRLSVAQNQAQNARAELAHARDWRDKCRADERQVRRDLKAAEKREARR